MLVTCARASTVTLALHSPQNGHVVALGATVDWAIWVTASPDDNEGLALVAVDLIQDAANNPATLDIPPGFESSIAPPMHQFSRPLGISNPGEGGASTGYIGVQRGAAGAMNLIQIGGGQNTSGAPGPPGIGEDYWVEGGIGQSGPVLVLTGQLTLPNDASASGTYQFWLVNGIANTLVEVNEPPDYSPVSAASVDSSGGVIVVTMIPEPVGTWFLVIGLSLTRRGQRGACPGRLYIRLSGWVSGRAE